MSNERTPGVIRADESYTAAEFCRRAGLARKAYLSARRHGLLVIEFGKKRFVRGIDWLSFLAKQAEETQRRRDAFDQPN